MTENPKKHQNYKIEKSALLTILGIALLFSSAIVVTLIAPRFVDPTWTQPTSHYQVQMYEVSDPNFYISSTRAGERQALYHLKADYTLLAFQENELTRILAPPELEKYVTRLNDPILKLTSELLLLRPPTSDETKTRAESLQKELTKQRREQKDSYPQYTILELYHPHIREAFSAAPSDSILENWVDHDYQLLDEKKESYHSDSGVIYVLNPMEYKIGFTTVGKQENWHYDPNGSPIANVEELKTHPLGFVSRQELIKAGEHIYSIEGCWYCHSDQTRTLVQDVVANGSEAFPAPPSSPNEYIYQDITFLSTRRIGPDLSRVGVKRQSRDWHQSHFWSPRTASVGSIMPAFRHFFDNDPRGTAPPSVLIPNYEFEAIFQYMMTKGTRITPPTQAWWNGKDPVKTIDIIDRQEV